MANLPSITHLEIVVVAGAAVLLYCAPAVLAWSENRRARRALREMASLADVSAPAAAPFGAPGLDAPLASPEAVGVEFEMPAAAAGDSAWGVDSVGPSGLPDIEARHPAAEPADAIVQDVGPVGEAAGVDAAAPIELRPLNGPPRHRFRFDDLHQTRLPEWPPAGVRNSPERHQVWQDAEQLIGAQRGALDAATILSPYPARSTCLGAAEAQGGTFRVSFLLFPALWPTSPNQAVAQAVFEIDRARGSICGWVDALRVSELSEDNRREIQESGGEI